MSARRVGCIVVAVAAVLVALGAAALVSTAVSRNRSAAPETTREERAVPTGGSATGAPGTLRLDVDIARVVLVPGPAGSPVTIEGEFDRRRYELGEELSAGADGRWTYDVRFGPRGSKAMALLQMKIGGRPPVLRIRIPQGVPVSLDARVRGGFAALELGGLTLEAVDVDVDGGATRLSFAEPLAAPMDRLDLFCDKGSLAVSGLGNASPRIARFGQHLGAIDLDLRGAWARSATVDVVVGAGGGSIWLPPDVPVDRADDDSGPSARPSVPETDAPRIRLTISEHAGRMVVIDEAKARGGIEPRAP